MGKTSHPGDSGGLRSEGGRDGKAVRSGVYADRHEAALALASALSHHAGKDALVLAIPRGAVPLGVLLARSLDAELDIVPVRKVGTYGNPELALAAVDGDGVISVLPDSVNAADDSWTQSEAARQLEGLRRRMAFARQGRPEPRVDGRVVIVVDDGLATGATMKAALGWARRRKPSWLVCAVPVAQTDSLNSAAAEADERVCPLRVDWLGAVSQFYLNFSQVSDEAVRDALAAQPRGLSFSKAVSP